MDAGKGRFILSDLDRPLIAEESTVAATERNPAPSGS
jgi:hypothetical protein